MITIYIKECEKQEILEKYNIPIFIKNIIWKIIKSVNCVIVRTIEENRKIYLIPNIEKEIVYKRIKRKLEKEKTKTQKIQIVLSKNIKKYKFYFQGYKIVDGKKIYISSLEAILEKILEEEPLALQDIYILTNKYNNENIAIIKRIVQKVKTVNVITKDIERYKVLEEIMNEDGNIISVANNKKKSLKKAKIIINLDFSKEELIAYSIFRDSIIINMTQEKIIGIKGFNGIIIQGLEITLEKEIRSWIEQNNLESSFIQLEVYETLKGRNIVINKEQISNLYGNHGKIDKKELRNWQKILTNEKN